MFRMLFLDSVQAKFVDMLKVHSSNFIVVFSQAAERHDMSD